MKIYSWLPITLEDWSYSFETQLKTGGSGKIKWRYIIQAGFRNPACNISL